MYSLKITLRDCPHPCYRELKVADTITLNELSWAINLAFGWNSSHLFDFQVDDKKMYGIDTEAEEYTQLPYKMAEDVTVHEAFFGAKKVVYSYDYGDGWKHDITFDHTNKIGHKLELVEGKGACPPDDCGGIGGYMQLLDDLKKPKSKTAKEWMVWLDGRPIHPQPWPEWIAQELIVKFNYFLMAGIPLNDTTLPIFIAWLESPLDDYFGQEDLDD